MTSSHKFITRVTQVCLCLTGAALALVSGCVLGTAGVAGGRIESPKVASQAPVRPSERKAGTDVADKPLTNLAPSKMLVESRPVEKPPPEPPKPAPTQTATAQQSVVVDHATSPPERVTPPVEKPVVPAERPKGKINLVAEKQRLLQRDANFAELSEQKGAAEAFYEFLSADATFLPSGELPIKGSETMRVRMAAGPQGTLTWTPEEADVSSEADMGYTWGNYTFRGRGPDGRVSNGKYICVWQKQDGHWKAVLFSENANPMPAVRRTDT